MALEHPTNRADPMGAEGFSLTKLIDHKVQQFPACGHIGIGQAEDVVLCSISHDSRRLTLLGLPSPGSADLTSVPGPDIPSDQDLRK